MSTGSNNSEVVDFFLVETSEHLQNINTDLLALEQQKDDMELVDRLFRAVHGIKGSAGMLGFSVISQFAHKIENLLGEVRDNKAPASGEIIDFLFHVIDILTQQIDDLGTGQGEDQAILNTFEDLYSQVLTPSSQPPEPKPAETPLSVALAEEFIKQNLIEKGIEVYQKLLRDDPTDITVRQRLAEARALLAYMKAHPDV